MTDQGYLLDTNVVSEVRRPRPDPRVVGFLAAVSQAEAFLSVLTIGELRRGAELKRRLDSASARRIDAWIDNLQLEYADRTLPVDREIATVWGELMADRSRAAIDTLLAATALVHGLALVTRNTRDVAGTGVTVVNPWI